MEICFIVRADVIEDFQPPIDELDFRRDGLEAAVGFDLPTVISVRALGLKYELLKYELLDEWKLLPSACARFELGRR